MENLGIVLGAIAVLVIGWLVLTVGWTLIMIFWPTIAGVIGGGYLISIGHKTWGIVVIILGVLTNFSIWTDDRWRNY